MRILVVEDEDAIAKPLVEGLRREGFEVNRVATGAEALAALASRPRAARPPAP
jgi:DNA-binding response OmpR family regulator